MTVAAVDIIVQLSDGFRDEKNESETRIRVLQRDLPHGQHSQIELRLIRPEDERPHRWKRQIRAGFQEGIHRIARWSFVVVDGHRIVSRGEIWNLKLEYLVFDPDKFFSGNFPAVGIGSHEFELGPVHHLPTDLDSRPTHQVLHRKTD